MRGGEEGGSDRWLYTQSKNKNDEEDSFAGGVVASPTHLLLLSFISKQMKWFHNGLCFLNEQTDIPEV